MARSPSDMFQASSKYVKYTTAMVINMETLNSGGRSHLGMQMADIEPMTICSESTQTTGAFWKK